MFFHMCLMFGLLLSSAQMSCTSSSSACLSTFTLRLSIRRRARKAQWRTSCNRKSSGSFVRFPQGCTDAELRFGFIVTCPRYACRAQRMSHPRRIRKHRTKRCNTMRLMRGSSYARFTLSVLCFIVYFRHARRRVADLSYYC